MSEQKRVRITSEGVAHGSKVTDLDGNEIPRVRKVTIRIDPSDEPVQADVQVSLPHVDVVADATIHSVCPYCGREQEES